MAENRLLGGMLGGEDGPAEDELGPAATPLDAAAGAMAMEAAKTSQALAAEASAYFRDQAALVRIQTEHLHEQREVQLSHLKLRRLGERMKLALQAFFILIGTGLAVGVLVMAWDAEHDHGLVVEAFSAPPDLAARGLSGQVIAKQVLDNLVSMQSQTISNRDPGSYSNNWGEALKVEIPETGVSLGEFRQYLHTWLGHQTHITGEVYRTANGLTVVARSGEQVSQPFSGAEEDLPGLLQKASEAVYEHTQPYRYARYLGQHGDTKRRDAFFRRLASSPNRLDRAWAHEVLGAEAGDRNDEGLSIREALAALADVPGFGLALGNISLAEASAGHDGAALATARAALRSYNDRRDVRTDRRLVLIENTQVDIDTALGNYFGATLKFSRIPDIGVTEDAPVGSWNWQIARLLIGDHDLINAAMVANSLPAETPLHNTLFGLIAQERHDPKALEFLRQSVREEEAQPNGHYVALRDADIDFALAEAASGELLEATRLAATLPLDCYRCAWARGVVATARGDRAEADRAFAEAIRQAPMLPQAFTARGVARLGWGAVDGALADAEQAHKLSPHYADALKLWGDALARSGDWNGARDRYEIALENAPHWIELKNALRLAQLRSA